MTEPAPTYTTTDYKTWHAQMESAGWVAVRDLFGCVLQYKLERPAGTVCAILRSCDFSAYAEVGRTPPPF